MIKLRKALAITLLAATVSVPFAQPVLGAEDDGMKGVASIEFTEGDTIIAPGPDPELPGIKSGDIYFGKQELDPGLQTYSSLTTHDDEERKQAGFVVQAGNNNGWNVTVQITGFALNDKDTMKDFILEMTPGEVQTTSGNVGLEPTASTVRLFGGKDKDSYGESVTIFKAEKGQGLGKWGSNWAGALTVAGGSIAEEGEATAAMLWSLNLGDVRI